MAPRTVKAKKTAEVKLAETEVVKKGRGRAKNVIQGVDSEVVKTDKRNKGEKKEDAEANGQNDNEDVLAMQPVSGQKSSKRNKNKEPAQNGDNVENNADVEEAETASTGKAKKKHTRKDTKVTSQKENDMDVIPKETRAKRIAKQKVEENIEKNGSHAEEQKIEPAKGRGKKTLKTANKPMEEEENDIVEEESKKPSASKGRKKAPPIKVSQEKSSETDESENEEQNVVQEVTNKPQAKGTKGKKNAKNAESSEDEGEVAEEFKEEDEGPISKRSKVTKKGKGNAKVEDEMDEEPVMEKATKGRKGQAKKPVNTQVETDEEPQDTGEPTSKRRRKAAEEKASTDTKVKAPLKNKATTNYEDIDFSNTSKNVNGKEWNFKISNWNVDGLRAWITKGGLDYIKYEKPDIICIQETKCSQDKLPDEAANLPGYHAYWLCGDKDGYAGVGIYTAQLAMNVHYGLEDEDLDTEGRIITAEYEQFYLICTYVPNAGRKLVSLSKRLKWNEAFRNYVKELDQKKPVIICGDMNVAHNEIDLSNPKTNRKNAGFTDEERAGMSDLLGDGFIDTYRHLNPDKTDAYTFWTYMNNSRAKNVGWRLDYMIMSERLLPSMCDSVIRNEVYGSDHCPITLFLHLTSANKPKE